MAIKSNETFKGVSLENAYIKALVNIDVAIYKDAEQRALNNSLGNKSIVLSDASISKIYDIIKEEAYPNATNIFEEGQP